MLPSSARRMSQNRYLQFESKNEMNSENISLSHKIIQHPTTPYKLWLEFEETTPWDNITNDFANIGIDTMDGRYYGVNVWTTLYAEQNYTMDENGNQIPDMIVNILTRECIQNSIDKILKDRGIEKVLNPSTFNLKFIDPYWGADEMENSTINSLLNELNLELNRHNPLYETEYELIARKVNNDDIILKLKDGRMAVVHLTWKSIEEIKGYPITRVYKNDIEFWTKEMSKDINDYIN